jgi:hypothetical protein
MYATLTLCAHTVPCYARHQSPAAPELVTEPLPSAPSRVVLGRVPAPTGDDGRS